MRTETPPALAPADVLLADGAVAVIRPLRPSDETDLLALHDQASDDSLRLRFFTLNRKAGRDYVTHLMQATEATTLTLVAETDGTLIGEATAERVSPTRAEIAFLVGDAARGRGVGSLLLEHLAAACHARGVRHFVADVMTENASMLQVIADAGFAWTRTTTAGVVSFDLSTAATARAVRAADDREFHAEARSLRPLLYARTVAVVGVRSQGGGIGRAVLDSITGGGFTGRMYVVHPRAGTIAGHTCHRRLEDLPEPMDLVVIAVPAAGVMAAMEDAAANRARSAVVISAGFSELGAGGARLQHDLLRVARKHSIRLVGPNCLGLLSNDPAISLDATFTRAQAPHGGLAIASQSGGVGIVMLDLARRLDLGVHTFVSLGNKADVSGNDLLMAWYDDPAVTAVALYLESFGNAPKFARIARRFAERKPLLAVVGGRSSGGVRAGSSHTAAAAAPSVAVDALFLQAGVIPCASAESLARTALFLTSQPRPRGRRLGIVSNAGGLGVLAADAAERRGLLVPELSAGLRSALGEWVQGTVGTSNPVDLGAGADATDLREVVGAVLDSEDVDALLVLIVATSVTDPEALALALGAARAGHPTVPVVLVPMGGLAPRAARLEDVAVFQSADEATEVLDHGAYYTEWLSMPRGNAPVVDEARADRARDLAQECLAPSRAGGTWLDWTGASALLGLYGLRPTGTTAHSPTAAAEAAAAVGFPVAVKVADPHVVHKTDRGLVRVGLRSAKEVRSTVRSFAAELGQDRVEVLVQPMAAGVELALGVARDPQLGAMVMIAAGGIATGVWDDRVFLLPPVTTQDAHRALRALRIWPLLEGYRGSERVAVDRVAEAVTALGQLAVDVPEAAELDLNPVLAHPGGLELVDVKVRLAPAAAVDAGVPRRLR